MARIGRFEAMIRKAYDAGFKQGRMQSYKDSLATFRGLMDGATKKRPKQDHVSDEKGKRSVRSNRNSSKASRRNSGGRKPKTNGNDAKSGVNSA